MPSCAGPCARGRLRMPSVAGSLASRAAAGLRLGALPSAAGSRARGRLHMPSVPGSLARGATAGPGWECCWLTGMGSMGGSTSGTAWREADRRGPGRSSPSSPAPAASVGSKHSFSELVHAPCRGHGRAASGTVRGLAAGWPRWPCGAENSESAGTFRAIFFLSRFSSKQRQNLLTGSVVAKTT